MKKEGRKGSQANYVYNEIKRKIITLEFQPGKILNEKSLMSRLKVGRTPLREALLMLKNENLILGLPNKPAYVKEMTLKDAKDLIELLMGIEKITLSLAVQRVTSDKLKKNQEVEKELERAVNKKNYWEIRSQNRRFHQLIAEASENQYIYNIYNSLRTETDRLSYLALGRDFENCPPLNDHHAIVIDHHRQYLHCLEKGDIDCVEKLAVGHIKLLQRGIIFFITKFHDEQKEKINKNRLN